MEILKLRVFFKHESPYKREIIEELTIYNDKDYLDDNIILPLNNFKLGLRVVDSDNFELPYLPKNFIEKICEKLPESAEKSQIKDWLEGQIMWIKLPKEHELYPDETRVIKLIYHDDKDFTNKRLSLFSIPNIIETKIISNEENFDTFYLIEAPSKYRLNFNLIDGKGIDGIYKNLTNSFISLRAPHEPGTYHLKFEYNVTLPWLERLYWGGLSLLIWSISIGLFLNVIGIINFLALDFNYYKSIIPILVTLTVFLLNLRDEPNIGRLQKVSFFSILLNLYTLYNVIAMDGVN